MTYIVKLTPDNVEDVIDNIHFEEPSVDPTYGNTSVRMYTNNSEGEKVPVVIETPWMKAIFGVSRFDAAGSSVPKFKLPLSFDKLGSYERQDTFKKFVELLDEKIIKEAHENAGAWLKKDGQPLAVVKAFYSPLLSYSKDKKGKINEAYPPKVQLKLGTYNNDDGTYRFAAPVYKDAATKLDQPTESIQRGTESKAIVEFTGIWEVSGKFGTGWRCNAIKIKQKESRSAYVFHDDSDDSDDDDDNVSKVDDGGDDADFKAVSVPAEPMVGGDDPVSEEDEPVVEKPKKKSTRSKKKKTVKADKS